MADRFHSGQWYHFHPDLLPGADPFAERCQGIYPISLDRGKTNPGRGGDCLYTGETKAEI